VRVFFCAHLFRKEAQKTTHEKKKSGQNPHRTNRQQVLQHLFVEDRTEETAVMGSVSQKKHSKKQHMKTLTALQNSKATPTHSSKARVACIHNRGTYSKSPANCVHVANTLSRSRYSFAAVQFSCSAAALLVRGD
jgi:hypothetical protein